MTVNYDFTPTVKKNQLRNWGILTKPNGDYLYFRRICCLLNSKTSISKSQIIYKLQFKMTKLF